MQGMMMHKPLSIIEVLRFAAEAHPGADLVSVRTEGDMHRTSYPETFGRAAQLAHALESLGIHTGDRVATLAWNGYRHFELYFGIAGIGAVCHTINPRLSAEQLVYITHHAADRLLFLDLTFVPIIEELADKLPQDMRYVIMTDRAHMPDTALETLCYEDLLEPHPTQYDWPELSEETACILCYTSGTTGNPKGALYSHRSTVLHAFSVALSIDMSLKEGARILPVVPLFHVNAWGLPFAAPLKGASLVFPGAALDGASLFSLMENEQVSSAWGVPTVWLGLQGEIAKQGRKPTALNGIIVGGSSAPKSMIETFEKSGVTVCHAWGMTEMSPVGTHGILSREMMQLPFEEQVDIKVKHGRRVFGVDMKIVNEAGDRLPHDGEAVGELYVSGNTIIQGYFNNETATVDAFDRDGWFGTGDIASIDADGFLIIQDRAKDLIKSGGEWISSIDLENVIMGHPEVANCAVIAVPHPTWDERPLLVIVPAGDKRPDKSEFDQLLLDHVAKWQLPDAVEFIDALPMTATGKVSKMTLRKQFSDYALPDMV